MTRVAMNVLVATVFSKSISGPMAKLAFGGFCRIRRLIL